MPTIGECDINRQRQQSVCTLQHLAVMADMVSTVTVTTDRQMLIAFDI